MKKFYAIVSTLLLVGSIRAQVILTAYSPIGVDQVSATLCFGISNTGGVPTSVTIQYNTLIAGVGQDTTFTVNADGLYNIRCKNKWSDNFSNSTGTNSSYNYRISSGTQSVVATLTMPPGGGQLGLVEYAQTVSNITSTTADVTLTYAGGPSPFCLKQMFLESYDPRYYINYSAPWTNAISADSSGVGEISKTIHLTGLQPNTTYWYALRTGGISSGAYWAYTPFYSFTTLGSITTGIKENINDDLVSTFPNPVNDMLTINSKTAEEYQITNALGSLIKSGIENVINVSDFANGVYFISIKTDKGSTIKKFIKQ